MLMRYVKKALPRAGQVQMSVQGPPQVTAKECLHLAGSRELTGVGELLVPPSLQYTSSRVMPLPLGRHQPEEVFH